MYENKFKPFHELHSFAEDDREKSPKVQEKVEDCRDFLQRAEGEIQALRENLKALEEEIALHKRQNQELLKEKETLLKEIEELKRKQEEQDTLVRIFDELFRRLEALKEGIKQDILNMSVDLVKKLLSLEALPKEEGLLKALSQALERGLVLGGSCDIHMNPEDKERLEDTIRELFQRAGVFSLNLIADKGLKRGEFILETPKLYVERKYEELLEDLLRSL
ncbi:MAG: hypothetical protein D6699_01235 [Aquificota bacterium]|nr:MAG: hypothetical protein D6699_01235 [Aquificota bacterium]